MLLAEASARPFFLVNPIFDMQLEEILSELENNTGVFPRLAVERAIEEQEAITPFLLATLEECKNNLEELFEEEAYILHLYALYLLAQFREAKAYPLIIDFFSIPGDITLDFTGDVVTEDLPRILACVCHGNIEPIKQLIENQEANEYVRDAALQSLVVLVVQGILPREQVIQYYDELFSTKFANEPADSFVWTHLVVNSTDICPIELKHHIDKLYEQDVIDRWFISQENVNDAIEMGVEAALAKLQKNQRYSWIDDTVSEMQKWACFRYNTDNKRDMSSLLENFKSSNKNYVSPIALERVDGFSRTNTDKAKANKKKKMQKESRKKNRSKKK
jgi:hypothetical protein